MDTEHFHVKFWGVRGSIACPGAETVRYGGNTSCVEMRIGQQLLIFDAGTGIRVLGETLQNGQPIAGSIFFTHTHWDHIQGFPFFSPAFINGNTFDIYGTPTPEGITIKQRLSDQMLHPNFPVPLQIMQGNLRFYDLELEKKISLGDVSLETAPLNHPGGCTGYRVEWRGRSVVFITDTEYLGDRPDPKVLHLAREADALIMDATYTDKEYYDPHDGKVGWGHSTWQAAVKLAKAANVKQLILFHHEPSHTDEDLDAIAEQVLLEFPQSLLAREGMTLEFLPLH
ncbi:MAG: MBL fold metallo-hydrolase [Microcystaceae cyanobacterium]